MKTRRSTISLQSCMGRGGTRVRLFPPGMQLLSLILSLRIPFPRLILLNALQWISSSMRVCLAFYANNSHNTNRCIERHHHLSEHQAKTIFRQIISAISYMHSRGVCHRDIKDENILIDSTLSVKLIDFGSAAFFDVPGGQKFDRFMGTIQYAAPEILRREKYRGPEAEVWALGCCLYIMLTGEVPFSTPDQALHSPFSSPSVKVSNTCHHLLSIMLEKRIGLRANIPEILAHPWLLNKAL